MRITTSMMLLACIVFPGCMSAARHYRSLDGGEPSGGQDPRRPLRGKRAPGGPNAEAG